MPTFLLSKTAFGYIYSIGIGIVGRHTHEEDWFAFYQPQFRARRYLLNHLWALLELVLRTASLMVRDLVVHGVRSGSRAIADARMPFDHDHQR